MAVIFLVVIPAVLEVQLRLVAESVTAAGRLPATVPVLESVRVPGDPLTPNLAISSTVMVTL